MKSGWIPGLPCSISTHQGHDHPLKVIQVLVDAFTRMGSFQKHDRPRIVETDVPCVGGWPGRIRPDDHLMCGLRGTVTASKFHKHAPTGLRIVRRAVSVVEGHTKQGADVAEVVLVLLGEPGPGDVKGVHLCHSLGPVESTPFELEPQESQVECKVVGHHDGAF
jgi:hypothetical protein